MAGVALGDVDLRFGWQARRNFAQTILACFTEAWWKPVQAMLSHALLQAMFQRCFSLGPTLGSKLSKANAPCWARIEALAGQFASL